MRDADREPDQRRADRADAAERRGDREPRAAPQARLVLVNAHRADDLVGRDRRAWTGDERARVIIDRVAIVVAENRLLARRTPARRSA